MPINKQLTIKGCWYTWHIYGCVANIVYKRVAVTTHYDSGMRIVANIQSSTKILRFMNIPAQYSDKLPLREQILYVLSVQKKGAASEVAMELMELKGISSEEGVADLTMETEQELEKLCEEGLVVIVREKREKKRYTLK